MLLVVAILSSIIGFPAVIFFDYHKRTNVHKAIWYVFIFWATWALLKFWLKILGLTAVYYLWLIPVVLFGVLFLKNWKKKI